jgi:hypothetical protein
MMQRYKTNRENVPSMHHILANGAMLQTRKNLTAPINIIIMTFTMAKIN